jgi:hypothetical protein
MCKEENGKKNLAKNGLTQLWIFTSIPGPCWSISNRRFDEVLKEIDIMWLKITLKKYEFFFIYYNKYTSQMYHTS